MASWTRDERIAHGTLALVIEQDRQDGDSTVVGTEEQDSILSPDGDALVPTTTQRAVRFGLSAAIAHTLTTVEIQLGTHSSSSFAHTAEASRLECAAGFHYLRPDDDAYVWAREPVLLLARLKDISQALETSGHRLPATAEETETTADDRRQLTVGGLALGRSIVDWTRERGHDVALKRLKLLPGRELDVHRSLWEMLSAEMRAFVQGPGTAIREYPDPDGFEGRRLFLERLHDGLAAPELAYRQKLSVDRALERHAPRAAPRVAPRARPVGRGCATLLRRLHAGCMRRLTRTDARDAAVAMQFEV